MFFPLENVFPQHVLAITFNSLALIFQYIKDKSYYFKNRQLKIGFKLQ